MYKLSFWFEHGGECLWSKNEKAREKFGYPVNSKKLPLSQECIKRIEELNKWYSTYLDWDNPSSGCMWSASEKIKFLENADNLYDVIISELGDEYLVVNDVADSL